jgi:hypothetical protein
MRTTINLDDELLAKAQHSGSPSGRCTEGDLTKP